LIAEIEEALLAWLSELTHPVPPSLGLPPAQPKDTGVACYLLSVTPEAPERGVAKPPVRALARFLVTAWAPEPLEAHRRLSDILVGASEKPGIELERQEPPLALWQCLGVPPQPALVIRSHMRLGRPQPVAPLVRAPLQVELAQLTSLTGTVVSPGGIPLARAEVRLAPAGIPVWTGPDGTFTLHGAWGVSVGATVLVTARGITRTMTLPTDGPTDAPVTVVFDPTEE
jgi:hypothetical protein